MAEQELSERMVFRTKALVAIKNAVLPGFCEGMTCDHTCPMYVRLPGNEPCVWQKTYRAIDDMEQVLLKSGKE
jgi:hypothetical protein